ncbi:putative UvsX protein [Erwinia phage vB_EamM_Stratton]|uniref:UvsX protein n=2 Tax=Erskinevirus EaH2 TaxID=2169883 RepID=J7KE31_9CAUD|nr:hypothetical protein G173_gp139 [Erwinia phage phiEaH2]AFQ96684.1 hypothetical protein [Erwinia phage phiEaH2]ANZ50664.1 putative UvsX protein [Erwinia phage vB_EamM_Stratton]
MAGPAKQVMGEVIRPRFNVYTIMDHALGNYEKGEDGLYYLNGGFAHIMGFAGRGNTFKSTLMDFCIFMILQRYAAAWGSKYDTEVTAALNRLETGFISAAKANGIEGGSVLDMIHEGKYNMVGSDIMPGEEYYSSYIRDEIENRFKEYMKGKTRETPFLDPVRRAAKRLLDPWLYSIDSLSEWHSSKIEDKHAETNVGDSEQNALNMRDSLEKSNMMSRWPSAFARGGFYMGFVAQLADDSGKAMSSGGRGAKPANAKLLDDAGDDLKFAGIPRRQLSFLTNSLLVATKSGELKHDGSYNAKTGVNEEKYPTARSKAMNASVNDLKEIVFTQYRAKGGHTGVKFRMVFSQEMGLLYHLSLWHYLAEVLKDEWGYTRSGANYELHLLPGTKFMRTTVRDMCDDDQRLRRALEITAALAYMQNNYHRLEMKYHITPEQLWKLIDEKWDWNEILDNTVEYWMFKDQEVKGGKRCLTAMSLLAMAVDGLEPKFLTKKK